MDKFFDQQMTFLNVNQGQTELLYHLIFVNIFFVASLSVSLHNFLDLCIYIYIYIYTNVQKQVTTIQYICPTGSQSYFKGYQVNTKYYIRLKIKPNSVRIRFQSCQIFVLPSTRFEPTPLIHCSTIRLALRPAPQTTRPHPLYI